MTTNQIAYWKNVETERSNRAREELDSQQRAIDRRKADISEQELLEKVRHNKLIESLEKQEGTRRNARLFMDSVKDTIQGIYGAQNQTMNLAKGIVSLIGSASK